MSKHPSGRGLTSRPVLAGLAVAGGAAWLLLVASAPLLPGARWLGEHTPLWVLVTTSLVLALALLAAPLGNYLSRFPCAARAGHRKCITRAAVTAWALGVPFTEVWMHYRLVAAEYAVQAALQLCVFWSVWRMIRPRGGRSPQKTGDY
jgi:hypothetical protein